MTNSTASSVVRFGKTALLLSSFWALAACSAHDFSPAEVLPDDPSEEIVSQEAIPAEDTTTAAMVENLSASTDLQSKASILANYDYVDPKHEINTKALENTLLYFHANKSKFANQNYVSVLDFSKRSTKARFHIIDMKTGAVWSIHVAHGKGSDSNHDGYAEKFSNKSGSNASSLGYYRTGETYTGKHGLSLKLDGLSSTNSNARARAVVIHGASYVKEASVVQGRSWGCPAVDMNLRTKVITMLKNGSLIYGYTE